MIPVTSARMEYLFDDWRDWVVQKSDHILVRCPYLICSVTLYSSKGEIKIGDELKVITEHAEIEAYNSTFCFPLGVVKRVIILKSFRGKYRNFFIIRQEHPHEVESYVIPDVQIINFEDRAYLKYDLPITVDNTVLTQLYRNDYIRVFKFIKSHFGFLAIPQPPEDRKIT